VNLTWIKLQRPQLGQTGFMEQTLTASAQPVAGPVAGPVPRPVSSGIRILLNEHSALTAMLRSMLLMVARGPGDEPERFFDVMRAMLFYIDEFPEKEHHPKETDVLFTRVARLAPELFATIERLEHDHMRGEAMIHQLQHDLLAWEMLGESRRSEFATSAQRYADFYLEHMKLEESTVLPAARTHFTQADWKEVDSAFSANRDIFGERVQRGAIYDRLFTRIVTRAPAPIGVGAGD
jgi:hemerythrin-like domain-containing protein